MPLSFLTFTTLPFKRTSFSNNRSPLHPRASAQQPSITPSQVSIQPSSKPIVTLTPYENNTFVLQSDAATILVDPWLEGDLVFLTPAFFRGRKPAPRSPSLDYTALDLSTVAVIVLTQGLPDHAHPPTLSHLPRSIPVVCPRSAVSLLRSLGYQHILEVTYGDRLAPVSGAALQVTALRGSVVGPPWSDAQLGFLFEFGEGERSSVYHEPHGNHDTESLRRYAGNLDAVIAPIVSTTIPALGNYALVNGVPEAMEVCRLMKPKTCVTFDNSRGEQTGLLTRFLKMDGGVDKFMSEVDSDATLCDMKVLRTDVTKEPVVIVGADL